MVNTRMSRAYKEVQETKISTSQCILEYAEVFKGREFQYLTLTHAPSSSVTSEQLAHLMILNSGLTADVHTSAVMRPTSIASTKTLDEKRAVQPASVPIDRLTTATDGVCKTISSPTTVSGVFSTEECPELGIFKKNVDEVIKKLKLFPKDGSGEDGNVPRATISDAFSVLQVIPESSLTPPITMSSFLSNEEGISETKRHRNQALGYEGKRAVRRRIGPLCYDCREPNHKRGSLLCEIPSNVGRKMQDRERRRQNTAVKELDTNPSVSAVTPKSAESPKTGFGYPGNRQ